MSLIANRIDSLPIECFLTIFESIDTREKIQCCAVSQIWKKTLENNWITLRTIRENYINDLFIKTKIERLTYAEKISKIVYDIILEPKKLSENTNFLGIWEAPVSNRLLCLAMFSMVIYSYFENHNALGICRVDEEGSDRQLLGSIMLLSISATALTYGIYKYATSLLGINKELQNELEQSTKALLNSDI